MAEYWKNTQAIKGMFQLPNHGYVRLFYTGEILQSPLAAALENLGFLLFC